MRTRHLERVRCTITIAFLLTVGCTYSVRAQSAAQLLKEGTYYQGLDDITDRAADRYRQILAKYPKSVQAERATFYLGTYFDKKFYILEERNRVQDWSSFNQAEAALNTYVDNYSLKGSKAYLADSYHTLAVIALRRGRLDDAKEFLARMMKVAKTDPKVFMYKVVWSPNPDDVVRGSCDSYQLAVATLAILEGDSSFSQRVAQLRNWCRANCR
ncbi:MAG TPA: hypothetical protein VKB46_12040 [Pyrinomonadaceae bacterium]|nr:hypothetical protein [Pyrinomonadaceae bacterium]